MQSNPFKVGDLVRYTGGLLEFGAVPVNQDTGRVVEIYSEIGVKMQRQDGGWIMSPHYHFVYVPERRWERVVKS